MPLHVRRDCFALPDDPPPSAAVVAVRPASARLQPKPRRTPSAAAASPAGEPKPRAALAAHPLARFMIALSATSAVFLRALVLL